MNKEKLSLFLERKIKEAGFPKKATEEAHEALEKIFSKYITATPHPHQIPLSEFPQVTKERSSGDSTDLLLLVSDTELKVAPWNRIRIKEALIREAGLPEEEADDIALTVQEKVLGGNLKTISVSLIRELVNNELFERGYQEKLKKQEILGMPVYNLNQVIFSKSAENSNILSNNPEAVNLAIAENSLKQYALGNIFSKDVATAHLKGQIHLHDLGYPVRVYCSAHSIEYIKKYGLELDNLQTSSAPAKHAGTLTGHINTFLASMQAYYAGALGMGYLNIFYAPLLSGMTYEKMVQEAQYLIYSCSQNAFNRGGQTLFIDFNVHLGIPTYLASVPAIGPGGKYIIKKKNGKIEYVNEVPRDKNGDPKDPKDGKILRYKDYEKESQMFLRALMDVWRKGDCYGRVFAFPKMDLHINAESFTDKKQLELLKYACQIASKNGSPYFIFDRDEVVLSACCRLRTRVKDSYVLKHPESIRFCGFQNVTINLPQAAYRAGRKNIEGTIKEIYKVMGLVIKAHKQKAKFIKKIMLVPGSPMWQVGKVAHDNRPYIDLDREDTSYIVGMLGLNECVKFLIGQELHESKEAYKLGLKIISAMSLKTAEYEKELGWNIKLEETPAESASLRLAKVDLKHFEEARYIIRGDKKSGNIYYTNSIHFSPNAPIDIIERIVGQGRFHSMIESGAITHVFVGEKRPSPESIFKLVKKTWENTQTAQITISPEFTFCSDCHKVSPGYGR